MSTDPTQYSPDMHRQPSTSSLPQSLRQHLRPPPSNLNAPYSSESVSPPAAMSASQRQRLTPEPYIPSHPSTSAAVPHQVFPPLASARGRDHPRSSSSSGSETLRGPGQAAGHTEAIDTAHGSQATRLPSSFEARRTSRARYQEHQHFAEQTQPHPHPISFHHMHRDDPALPRSRSAVEGIPQAYSPIESSASASASYQSYPPRTYHWSQGQDSRSAHTGRGNRPLEYEQYGLSESWVGHGRGRGHGDERYSRYGPEEYEERRWRSDTREYREESMEEDEDSDDEEEEMESRTHGADDPSDSPINPLTLSPGEDTHIRTAMRYVSDERHSIRHRRGAASDRLHPIWRDGQNPQNVGATSDVPNRPSTIRGAHEYPPPGTTPSPPRHAQRPLHDVVMTDAFAQSSRNGRRAFSGRHAVETIFPRPPPEYEYHGLEGLQNQPSPSSGRISTSPGSRNCRLNIPPNQSPQQYQYQSRFHPHPTFESARWTRPGSESPEPDTPDRTTSTSRTGTTPETGETLQRPRGLARGPSTYTQHAVQRSDDDGASIVSSMRRMGATSTPKIEVSESIALGSGGSASGNALSSAPAVDRQYDGAASFSSRRRRIRSAPELKGDAATHGGPEHGPITAVSRGAKTSDRSLSRSGAPYGPGGGEGEPVDMEGSRSEAGSSRYEETPGAGPSSAGTHRSRSEQGGDEGDHDRDGKGKGKKRSSSPDEGDSKPRKVPRQKIDVACDYCRRRKMRCDGIRPTCHNCQKNGVPCTYEPQVRRRGPGKKPKVSKPRPKRGGVRSQSQRLMGDEDAPSPDSSSTQTQPYPPPPTAQHHRQAEAHRQLGPPLSYMPLEDARQRRERQMQHALAGPAAGQGRGWPYGPGAGPSQVASGSRQLYPPPELPRPQGDYEMRDPSAGEWNEEDDEDEDEYDQLGEDERGRGPRGY